MLTRVLAILSRATPLRTVRFRYWPALVIVLVFGAGCAKIGDPQPPEVLIPKPATDLSVRQISDYLVLTVSRPVQNTDGSPSTTLTTLDVFRLVQDSETPPSGEHFLNKAVRIMSIPASRFADYLEGNRFVIKDGPPELYSSTLGYAVLFQNNRSQTAGPSNQVFIRPVPIPGPPSGLEAAQTETSIRLTWQEPAQNLDGSSPPRIEGYNVYRSEQPDSVPSLLLNATPVKTAVFEDQSFRFDSTYVYSVSTVGSSENPNAQSLPSPPLKVVARDSFPPAPPQRFSAILEGNTAILLWVPSPAQDTAGYVVYRHEKEILSRTRVSKELIRDLSWRDEVDPGKDYEYSIQAVDTHGNESVVVTAPLERR